MDGTGKESLFLLSVLNPLLVHSDCLEYDNILLNLVQPEFMSHSNLLYRCINL